MAGQPGRLSSPRPQIKVLNDSDTITKKETSAVDASRNLQKLMLRMKGDVIAEDGSGVKYEALKNNQLFIQYKEQAEALKYVNLSSLSEDEKMAFFINVYNALTIHGLAECDILPDSVLNIKLFWKTTAYKIGEHVFTLDDIEHGVLRGNRPHPGAKNEPFGEGDKRRQFVMKKFDPRIHFALVCGAKSCPVINVYSATNLNNALDAATKNFCDQEVKCYEMQREIHISKIFQWYRSDFGANDVEAISWTIPFLSEEKQNAVKNLIYLLEKQGMVDIHYKEYDWKLNSVDKKPQPILFEGETMEKTVEKKIEKTVEEKNDKAVEKKSEKAVEKKNEKAVEEKSEKAVEKKNGKKEKQ